MRFYSDTLGLSSNEFALLRDLIHERIGLSYDNGKSGMLLDKLSPRVVERGFDSFLDYYYLLKYDPAAGEEWRRVVDVLAVPETYFWREMDQVRALVNTIVPRHFAGGTRTALRIWSAACAGGEEPLSIAMALNEAGWLARAPIEIYASDASPAAIARARAGIYRDRSFRALPSELRSRYFTPLDEGGERIAPTLRDRVHWQVANLMAEDEYRLLASAHVIFCRNVFIYFSETAIGRVASAFHRSMPSPGYLFLGASESLLRVTTGFQLQEVDGAFVYVKP